MTLRRFVYPGTFDPPTLGHIDIVQRAAALADEIVIAVAHNASKNPWFSAEERKELWVRIIENIDLPESVTIRVEIVRGLIASFCAANNATHLVKGVRNGTDVTNEMNQAWVNRQLRGLETVLLPCRSEFIHISSTIVKDVAQHGGDTAWAVPKIVVAALDQKKTTEG